MFKGVARLEYYTNYAIAWTDRQIGEYYYSLLPKYLHVQRQKEHSHITVCRKDIETPDYTYWRYREREVIEFTYDGILYHDDLYVWLDVYSEEIGEIREMLGLSRMRDGFDCYHLTIANLKNILRCD